MCERGMYRRMRGMCESGMLSVVRGMCQRGMLRVLRENVRAWFVQEDEGDV